MSADLFSLKGKVALITGGTSGLGQGIVRGLYEAGAELILIHRPSTNPTAFIEEVKKSNPDGASIHTIELDLLDADLAKLEETVTSPALEKSSTGKIDILINNAAIAIKSEFTSFTEKDYTAIQKVNVDFPFRLTQLVTKHFIKNQIKGRIIFTASLYSFEVTYPNQSVYATTKGAINSLMKALSVELASKGITVNSLVPGFIKSNMTADSYGNEKKSNEIVSRIPIGRWGEADDFKGPTVFLCSEAAAYLTGVSLPVDGGWLSK
ncbi:BA75_00079T0 [Komagataella pastoris]|uniref:BA75_00079T0 n=1 Tax=Komagataella pastoris TaxID=4922 RepID=A0A1B2J9B7_PICPA|nr:BA75_00079T0 [Komagataella pastoris]